MVSTITLRPRENPLVISGTIYEGTPIVMGSNVLVPSHVYKIIIDPKNKRAMSFLFPNTNLKVSDLPKFLVSIKEIETRSGVNFNPLIPNASMEEVKANIEEW